MLALVLFVAGFVVGGALKTIIKRVCKRIRLDDVLMATGAQALAERIGVTLNTGVLIGTLAQWFAILFFLDLALNALNLEVANQFLGDVLLSYVPRIFIAAAILLVAFVLAHVAGRSVVLEATQAKLRGAKTLGRLTRVVVLVCAVLAALIQLHIMAELALILFAGMVFAVSLALGIAFGHGGRESAAEYLQSLTRKEKGE